MLKRHDQWVERLDASLQEHKDKPFAWGEHDCALAVCKHIQAFTGLDLGADIRGKYNSEAGVAAAIAKAFPGAGTLEQAVEQIAAQHGIPEIKPLYAQRGDVVLFDTPQGQALAIVHLNGRHAIIAAPDGSHPLKVHRARRAWRIGHVSPDAALETA